MPKVLECAVPAALFPGIKNSVQMRSAEWGGFFCN
jgi:hypothetical protein